MSLSSDRQSLPYHSHARRVFLACRVDAAWKRFANFRVPHPPACTPPCFFPSVGLHARHENDIIFKNSNDTENDVMFINNNDVIFIKNNKDDNFSKIFTSLFIVLFI